MNTDTRVKKPELSWLENPAIFQVNRLPAHSDHEFYEDISSYERGEQTLKQSLNGKWQLKWSPNPEARPKEFMKEGYDSSSFDLVTVPAHLELQGYDKIHYIDSAYPWDGYAALKPPFIDMEHNPVASYVKEFDLDGGLMGKRICLSFQGAEQAIYVWLNGTFVGYAEDSFTPSDFDITELVRERGNRLCVELYKRSSAAWIEDQDFFRFSGLFREVYLYAKPEGHVEDIRITSDYDVENQEGIFGFCAKVSGAAAKSISWKLLDGLENVLAEGETRSGKADNLRVGPVIPWNVGNPQLYQLLLTVQDDLGKVQEIVPYKVGFRHFEIRDKVMMLNGTRLLINGVNRHEWSAKKGRAISEEEMLEDIRIFKENGITAVRTSHYPNQSLWYRLCDEAGICVMDEANLESHGSWSKASGIDTTWNVPGSREEWLACCLDRAKSMFERDKNHPSILWWSCGNESHIGTVIQQMAAYFHEADAARLVHYEGVWFNRDFDFITDVESRMYFPPEKVREYLEQEPKKPMLLCEFMHDMGNSLGGMESYMKLREEFPMFQGGFLWDYIDQAVYLLDKKDELGYGGDFGDRITEYSFCGNGLLFADRSPKPAMSEVRYWYLSEEKRQRFDRENQEKREAFYKSAEEEKERTESGSSLSFIYSDCSFALRGEGFHYIFSLDKGGPVSLLVNGREQIYRAPKPTFWRAATENDIACNFPKNSSMWAGADLYSKPVGCEVKEAEGDAEICYTYETATMPKTTVTITYRVNSYGRIKVSLDFKGNEAFPELPVFGLQFFTEKKIGAYSWDGLSGETYPDRYKGAKMGSHEENVGITSYLVPQECENHMETVRAKIGDMTVLLSEKPFHFSVLPYTWQQLEAAFHKEELPESRRSVVRILGEMRGVGGINTWGADVEEDYHVSGQKEHHFEFYLIPNFSF